LNKKVISLHRNQKTTTMKKWIIEVIAPDEAVASKYLRTLSEMFEIADHAELPLNSAVLSDKETKLTCNVKE
jgi:hypothetical protein